jgi:hypothetical protein
MVFVQLGLQNWEEKMTTHVPVEAFERKVLDHNRHGPIVGDIDHYARRAGIAPHHIWTRASLKLGPDEIKYLKQCRSLAATGKVGAYYIGEKEIVSHMALMVGALVRALVDARMMMVRQIVEMADDGDDPEATVLFIPNFYMVDEFGKYDSRKIAALMDLLYSRAARSQPTVIHLSDHKMAAETFGKPLRDLLTSLYVQLTAGGKS